MLGGEEVVFHEAFDVAQAWMFGVAKPDRDLALDVKRQAFLGPAGEEMHVAANRPEKILAAKEPVLFVAVENAAIDQFLWLANPIDILGDPKQRVQIAQSALAAFDIRLDPITRLSDPPAALFALGTLGGDELRRGSLHHFLVEPRGQLVVEFPVA